MCVFSSPKPPPLPEPRPTAPMPEKTAKAPLIGEKRKKAAKTGKGKTLFKKLGTSSLQIPLNTNMSKSDLNY